MQKRRRKTPYIPILTGVTFAFVLASLGFIALMITLNNPFAQVSDVDVPDLVGMRFDTAVGQYDEVVIVQVETVNNDIYGAGVIFEQSPRAGRRVKEGSTIEVKVSSGQAVVTLRNFEGITATQAYEWLEDAGLKYETQSVYHSTIPAGSVVYTNPGRDSDVNSGETVTVYVSLGTENPWSTMPSVIGLTVDNARLILGNSGFVVGQITYEESEEPADTIIAQDPAPNGQQPEGISVNLVVSTGKESSFQRVAIPVELPLIDRLCLLQAYQDGQMVAEETINPAEVGVWKPWFSGDSTNAVIEIYLDGQLLREYTLDLQEAVFTPQSDFSGDFLD